MSKQNPVREVPAASCPHELSAELTKFAITNASKDASALEAAVYVTAHNFVDEDGDDALDFAAVVGGNPNHVADLLIDVMTTLVETRPLLAIKFHEALVKFMRKKLVEKSAADRKESTKENVVSALEALVRSLAKGTEE